MSWRSCSPGAPMPLSPMRSPRWRQTLKHSNGRLIETQLIHSLLLCASRATASSSQTGRFIPTGSSWNGKDSVEQPLGNEIASRRVCPVGLVLSRWTAFPPAKTNSLLPGSTMSVHGLIYRRPSLDSTRLHYLLSKRSRPQIILFISSHRALSPPCIHLGSLGFACS